MRGYLNLKVQNTIWRVANGIPIYLITYFPTQWIIMNYQYIVAWHDVLRWSCIYFVINHLSTAVRPLNLQHFRDQRTKFNCPWKYCIRLYLRFILFIMYIVYISFTHRMYTFFPCSSPPTFYCLPHTIIRFIRSYLHNAFTKFD